MENPYDFFGDYKITNYNGENEFFSSRISNIFTLNSNGVFAINNNGNIELGKFSFIGTKFIVNFNDKDYEFDVTHNSVSPYAKEIQIRNEKSSFNLFCNLVIEFKAF